LGTGALTVVGLKPDKIQGEYFTDRYTKGDLTLRHVSHSTKATDFSSAVALFGSTT